MLITGLNGTVAPILKKTMEAHGFHVEGWDRARFPAEDLSAIEQIFDQVRPEIFCHIGMGSQQWAGKLAGTCAVRNIRFLYTSSVSVFSNRQTAPIPPETVPDATDDYGRYKAESETAIRSANPKAILARLGWQIGRAPGNNNMVSYFTERMAREGVICASTRWVPSCCFLEDTAETLRLLLERGNAGTYQIEGNPGLNFFQICSGINAMLKAKWKIEATDDFIMDNRMGDPRLAPGLITRHLPEIPRA